MNSYIDITSEIENPRFGHAWRDKEGACYATVRLTWATMRFGTPAAARAVAAACIAAAEAMEALPPAQATPLPDGQEPPECGAQIADSNSASGHFVCTERPGHSGDHVAGGARSRDEGPLTWPQDAPDNSYQGYRPRRCRARGAGYICLATSGHTGDHVAYGPADENGDREVCHTWPQVHACVPGRCGCGATVDGAGNVTPAGAL